MCFLSAEWAMSSGGMVQRPRWRDTSPEVSMCVTVNIVIQTCNCCQPTLYLPQKSLLLHPQFQEKRMEITYAIIRIHLNQEEIYLCDFIYINTGHARLRRQEIRLDRWKKLKRWEEISQMETWRQTLTIFVVKLEESSVASLAAGTIITIVVAAVVPEVCPFSWFAVVTSKDGNPTELARASSTAAVAPEEGTTVTSGMMAASPVTSGRDSSQRPDYAPHFVICWFKMAR